MVDLIAFLKASKNGNRLLKCRLIDHDRLETALESLILLNIFPVFVECRRTDAVEFAAGQHGFQHIAGIHRAVRFSCTDDQMQLINEENDLSLRFPNLLEHGLQPLLELAAVLRAGDQRTHIKGKDLLILQIVRHIPGNNSLCKSFDRSGLAYAGLSDQDRVILRLS